MTKRFELRLCSNGTYYVYENGTLTDIDFDKFNKESAYNLIDKVNALYNEKEQLKIFLKAVNEELDLANRDCDILEEKNEKLKQFKEKVFALIDKEIARNEEAIKWEKETIADSGSIEVYNYMLNRLKKELQEMTENKRFERIYADVDVFCRDHNAKGVSQLIEREDYDRIVDLLNDLSAENVQLKQRNEFLKKRCDEYWEEAGLNSDYFE